MQTETFEEILDKESDAICMPITVNFKKADFNRWYDLNRRIRAISSGKKSGISKFARLALVQMLNDIESLVIRKEQEIHGHSSSVSNDRDEAS